MVRNNASFHRRCLVHSCTFEIWGASHCCTIFRLQALKRPAYFLALLLHILGRLQGFFELLLAQKVNDCDLSKVRNATDPLPVVEGILAQGHCKPTCLIISLHPRRPKQTSLSSLGHDRYLLILYIHWHPLAAVGSCLCLLTSHKCLPRGVAWAFLTNDFVLKSRGKNSWDSVHVGCMNPTMEHPEGDAADVIRMKESQAKTAEIDINAFCASTFQDLLMQIVTQFDTMSFTLPSCYRNIRRQLLWQLQNPAA